MVCEDWRDDYLERDPYVYPLHDWTEAIGGIRPVRELLDGGGRSVAYRGHCRSQAHRRLPDHQGLHEAAAAVEG